jgi:hypothetical protein
VGCLGILIFLALIGALMVAAWLCGLSEAKPPIDPTIGFRDPSGITGNCIGSDVSTRHRRSRGVNVPKPVRAQTVAKKPRADAATYPKRSRYPTHRSVFKRS